MATVNRFLLPLFAALALLNSIAAQNPSGFISLDCGLPPNTSYSEPITGLIYESDAAFVNSGTVHNISENIVKSGLNKQLWTLRSFPDGDRNCYKLRVKSGTRYLIRASFLYGNYDGRGLSPGFDLHFGPNFWDSVVFGDDSTVHKEIIRVVSSSNLHICVVNIGSGTPFISALELRPLRNSAYETPSPSMSLVTFRRLDLGSINNRSYRYKDDEYDRIWNPFGPLLPVGWTSISTSEQVEVSSQYPFRPAPAVMSTAVTRENSSDPLTFTWQPPDSTTDFFFYLYFSELQKLRGNESRAFQIFLNRKIWYNETISPEYLELFMRYTITSWTGGTYEISLVKTADSTLPPIINAVEIYRVINFNQSETNEQDVDAIANIRAIYGVIRNWQGDPCAPDEFVWRGVNCSNVNSDSLRITSLNLSSNGLTGEISEDIANLRMLENLDLSNNSLSGKVPDFLTQLPSLRVLNLERNKLSGVIPAQLVEKSESGSLSLRFGDNPDLLTTAPSEKKKHNIVVPLAASVGGFVLLLILIAAAIFWGTRRRKRQGAVIRGAEENEFKKWKMVKRHYCYSDILRITNNFERMLGEGGFGRVYYGRIENIEVAVKMLSPQSVQGYQQFQAEVELLMRVHHRNLTGLVGYCNEITNKGLIYEYMSNGNLRSLLSDGNSFLLSWENRLRIAVDAAYGLEYLHNGIRPAIIHRDIKPANILLDDDFQAKVSDFGLSRIFPIEAGVSHVSTNVAGTLGYLDPEYYTSCRLNEKSDVYGFGVVLVEIITGKPALTKTRDNVTHICKWVDSMLSLGDIGSIIDPNLKEDFDVNSIWKAVEIAMSCASPTSAMRPKMSQVVVELNECLALELARYNHHQPEIVADSSSLFTLTAR